MTCIFINRSSSEFFFKLHLKATLPFLHFYSVEPTLQINCTQFNSLRPLHTVTPTNMTMCQTKVYTWVIPY